MCYVRKRAQFVLMHFSVSILKSAQTSYELGIPDHEKVESANPSICRDTMKLSKSCLSAVLIQT